MKNRLVTQTLNNCLNLHSSNLPASCEQSNKCITEQQAHEYLGLCTLQDFKILNETGNGNAGIINNGVIPLELGGICKPMLQPSLQYSCTQAIPILISCTHGHQLWRLHCNWGSRYTIMLVDRATRFRWI